VLFILERFRNVVYEGGSVLLKKKLCSVNTIDNKMSVIFSSTLLWIANTEVSISGCQSEGQQSFFS
jgi:hypothetical protein